MKKSIKTLFLIAAIAASTLTASAIKPSYRGFVDFGGALLVGNSDVDPSALSIETGATDYNLMFSTTHGVQINRSFFVGVGLAGIISNSANFMTDESGRMCEASYNKNYNIPVYLSGRWDMNIARKVSPFVSLNLGYNINSTNTDGDASTLFIQPSAGIRIRLHHHVGFNIGLTFYSSKFKTGVYDGRINWNDKWLYSEATYSRYNFGLNIGLDF